MSLTGSVGPACRCPRNRKGPRALSALSLRHVDNHRESSAAFLLHVEIGGVVRKMAVYEPFTGLARFPDDVVPLTRPHVDRISFEPRRLRQRVAVPSDNREWAAMNEHRMTVANHAMRK